MNSKNANKVLETIAEEFMNNGGDDGGDGSGNSAIPKYIADVMIRCPEVPCSKWSNNNQMLMQFGVSGYTTDARGYNQWSKVGRHVKKGAKARYILSPNFITVPDGNGNDSGDGNDNTGNGTKQILVGFKTIPVFAVQDTDGAELPTYTPKVIPPLSGLANIQYRDSEDGEGGAYNVNTGVISLSTENIAVYFHELVHKYDSMNYKLKTTQDPVQEIVAELGAAVLCRLYDVQVPNPDNHMAYIATYAGAKTPVEVGEACLKVSDRVMTAITKILEDAATLQ